MIGGIGAPEIILVLLVLVLLFGAKKLPELARGSGRALRIFKAETKGLLDDEDDKRTPEQRQVDAGRTLEPPPARPPVAPPTETPSSTQPTQSTSQPGTQSTSQPSQPSQPSTQPTTRPTGEPPAT
jgi:sec-independent protein translocase protein TatA